MFRSCIKVFSKTTIRKCSRKASLIFWQTTWKHLCRSTSLKFLQKKTCFARNESRSQEHHLYKILVAGCSNVFCNGFFFVWSVSAHEVNQNRNLSCCAAQFFYVSLSFGSLEFLLELSCYFNQRVPKVFEKKIKWNRPNLWYFFDDEIFPLPFIS